MSSLQWNSILPIGAFSSSALPEDLAPALEQLSYFGKNSPLLAPPERNWDNFPRIKERIFRQTLIPQQYVSLEEFSLSKQIAQKIAQGSHFAIIIDQEPSAAAIEQMLATKPWLEQLNYVVLGRKDWRFKDTYRSLPHFIRPRLFLDFPTSLHQSDPFYTSAELTAILDELQRNCGQKNARSFCPHFHLRRELLGANVIAVSAPGKPSEQAPELSIVATEPEVVNQLASAGTLQRHGGQIEIVVPRVIGGEMQVTPHAQGAAISHVWLHLEKSTQHFLEIQAHLRNWGAQHSSGKSILFADSDTLGRLDEILDRLFVKEEAESTILRSGLGTLVDTACFRRAGGFDPLYQYFGLGNLEFLYRYLDGFRPEVEENGELAKCLRAKICGPHSGLGLALFYHQYFDLSFFRFFLPHASGEGPSEKEAAGSQHFRNQFRYRMEQSRDAYLSLYKASPRVALHGNIQLFLRPYHWIKPHAWRIKMPFHQIKPHVWRIKMPIYPLAVKPFHWVKPHVWRIKMPFHQIKPHVWRIKMPFHQIKPHVWRIKMPVVRPYHFLRRRIWKLKLAYYFLKGNLWRIKQVYYFFFRLLFPIRKVFYFCEYQYEKRILGLYGKQHTWIQK